jgi:uncharacterized protein (TIGR02996 family)
MPDLPALLEAIRANPADGPRWLALAACLWDNGRDDEAAVVRAYWPVLRVNVTEGNVYVEANVADVARHAAPLGRRAREVEWRAADQRRGADD